MTILISMILALIAVLHVAWGFGVWIPIRDEAQLVRAVVGARAVDRMPGMIPCLLVAGGLLIVLVALWLPQMGAARVVLWIAAPVFFIRGVLAYVPFWRRMTPEEPFNTYDQRLYGPLCIALGLGLLITLL